MSGFPFELNYKVAGSTIKRFHETNGLVKCLQGPLGSGKTTACVWEIFFRSMLQQENKRKRRQTKWIVVKNTLKQMWRVVMPIWFSVFPRDSEYTKFNQQYMIHKIDIPLTDGTIMDMEVQFISADNASEEDFKGINATAAWICEASDVPPGAINAAKSRVGRYPLGDKDEFFATWYGTIMDTNPPDHDDWLCQVFKENYPGWYIFKQPSGLSENAENVKGKSPTYYQDLSQGRTQAWIDIFVHGKEGFTLDGKVVFPEWNDDIHCARQQLIPLKSQIVVGVDYGLTPGAIFLQMDAAGTIISPAELTLTDAGVIRLADAIKATIAKRFPDHQSNEDVVIYGDPAGNNRSANDEKAAIDILRAHTGYRCYAAPTNATEIRLEAVRRGLTRLVDGKPGFMIDSSCKMLRKGFNGKYYYKKVRGNDGNFENEPYKNGYSHIQDALQYGLLGLGQAKELIKTPSQYGSSQSDAMWQQLNQQLKVEFDSWGI